ncbi:hypothetical protein DYB32_003672 [Aphanomyces invadans]|uniref:Palmitoyltransferase n=1 Tax=Aphanomyces invadans TaxID=157072 RepID=A0A418AZT0_9STRA|nr:hypothetical protein DYB32_003672 [Aphanomyces invadans]
MGRRYELNQKYDAHLDYFSVERLTKNPAMVESLHHGFKNRMITVFWYMSDVPKGGHTVFPRAGGAPQPTDYTDCSKGLLSTPQKRKVIDIHKAFSAQTMDAAKEEEAATFLDGNKSDRFIWIEPAFHRGKSLVVRTSKSVSWTEAIGGILLLLSSLVSYGLVACIDPGVMPYSPMLKHPTDSYCDYCASFRPTGTTHCSECQVCILDYDHHCPWTGKCIGKYNLRYFYLWLITLVISFVFEMIELTKYLLPPLSSSPPSH